MFDAGPNKIGSARGAICRTIHRTTASIEAQNIGAKKLPTSVLISIQTGPPWPVFHCLPACGDVKWSGKIF